MAVVHGGPGAGGEVAPVARELSWDGRGVLEPIQTATSLEGQVEELAGVLEPGPFALVGYSWGAWLSLLVAARHPERVSKIILVSSGPFEGKYLPQLIRGRMERLDESERREFEEALRALNDPSVSDKDARLRRLGELTEKSDSVDPLPANDGDEVGPQGDVFQRVWAEASGLRSSGELLRQSLRVSCPVIAIHGEQDPHPAAGVSEPLAPVLKRFHLLKNCGHTPWRERRAMKEFYNLLIGELD